MAQFRLDFGLAIILTILFIGSQEIHGAGPQPNKLICLYNSSSFVKEGKFEQNRIELLQIQTVSFYSFSQGEH